MCLFFFFKQKTAYEMRISDWSSDVCSSDLAKGQGVIINTASVQGLQSQKGAAAYAASKGGIISMTRQLALEYAEDNIRVVAIAPGTFDTPLLRDVAAGIPDKGYMERLRQAYPIKSFGDPAEMDRVVASLPSAAASFLPGACITLDTGITAQGGRRHKKR